MIAMLAFAHSPVLAASDGGYVVPIVAIVFGCLVVIVKTIAGVFTKRHEMNLKAREGNPGTAGAAARPPGAVSGDDAESVRRMQAAVDRLEQRIEALETILIERSRAPR